MKEKLKNQTKEDLLNLYLEVKGKGNITLGNKLWKKLVRIDAKETREKLEKLRVELNK